MSASKSALALLPLAAAFFIAPAAPPPPAVATSDNAPPADAIVLFDGTSLKAWKQLDGSPPKWTLENPAANGRAMTIAPGSGNLITTDPLGDCQLHIEFKMPSPANGEGQDRGNSGVYFQTRYEVQVLDSFKSETYPDGQCGAIYKKHAPLVNACREPGVWQTYDIIFRGPKYDAAGKKSANALLTVIHNGVLIQDRAEADSPTGSAATDQEKSGPAPLMLQDHGHKVQYRNIWVRKL